MIAFMPDVDLAGFPARIPASSARDDLWYESVPGLFAVHGRIPASLQASARLVLNEGGVAVLSGAPGRAAAAPGVEAVTPVYALHPAGPPAVPTGLVFVRFTEPTTLQARRDEIMAAGYTIVEVPAYAPHAAWVRAAHGGIAASLAGAAALAGIPGVVSVEPQMLSESVRR